MFWLKLYSAILSLALMGKVSICPCYYKSNYPGKRPIHSWHFSRIARLSPQINESSGLFESKTDGYWTHNDGNDARLFHLDKQWKLDTSILLQAPFLDFEEISGNRKGELYLGDFGNNQNLRTNLRIYMVNEMNGTLNGTIAFRYADQPGFPPLKRNYDCEAMCWYNDSLYLFSKNRNGGPSRLYRLPANPGEYQVAPVDSFLFREKVTGAAIRSDARLFVVLTYGYVYLFEMIDHHIGFGKPVACFRFRRSAQSEAIAFETDTSVFITNEQGKIFRLKWKVF